MSEDDEQLDERDLSPVEGSDAKGKAELDAELDEMDAADSGGGESTPDADAADGTDASAGESASETKYCADCGAEISRGAEICPECGVRQEPDSVAGSSDGNSSESVLAALLSFLIPGAGNFLNGQSERGTIILVLWIAWLVAGWGIGLVLIGGMFTLLTLGIGAILLPIIALLLSVGELVIHVLAAVDAYHQSEIVDRVTVRARNARDR